MYLIHRATHKRNTVLAWTDEHGWGGPGAVSPRTTERLATRPARLRGSTWILAAHARPCAGAASSTRSKRATPARSIWSSAGRRDRPFSRTELARRVAVDLTFGQAVSIVTPEDAILSKLEWAQRSGDSEKQLADAAGVLDINPALDREYIAQWAQDLGVTDLWMRISSHSDS